MKYYVYIIKSTKRGTFYTGLTNDVFRRIEEHNRKKKDIFKLVHCEECLDRRNARVREKFWKSGIGREIRAKFVTQ